MSFTYIQYGGKSVPLAGIGQWAGAGGPGQKTPLNAVRHASGRYYSYADYTASQQGGTQNGAQINPGTRRPMAPLRSNFSASQGQAYGWQIALNAGESDNAIQGQFAGYRNVFPGTAFNVAVSPTNIWTSPTTLVVGTFGQGGNGGGGATTPTFPGQPGGNGDIGITIATNGARIFNYGSIYGGGGGGGGGGAIGKAPPAGVAFIPGAGGAGQYAGVYGPGIMGDPGPNTYPSQPGYNAFPWARGEGGRASIQGQVISGAPGGGTGNGQAGQYGNFGYQYNIPTSQYPGGNGGAAGQWYTTQGPGAYFQVAVGGTHN